MGKEVWTVSEFANGRWAIRWIHATRGGAEARIDALAERGKERDDYAIESWLLGA